MNPTNLPVPPIPARPTRPLAGNQHGLSLIEILIVLAIIGLLMSGVAIVAIKAWVKAQNRAAGKDIAELSAGIEMYWVDHGRCPAQLDDLVATGLIKKLRKDPWGGDYVLTCPGEHEPWDIVSAGEDLSFATEDDIESWTLER